MSSKVIYFPNNTQRPVAKEEKPTSRQLRARPKKKIEHKLRCWAFTAKGTRCKKTPQEGEMFCHTHKDWDGILKPGHVLTDRAKITMSLTQDKLFLMTTSFLCVASGVLYLLHLLVQKIASHLPIATIPVSGSILISYGIWTGFLLLFLNPRTAIFNLADHLFTLIYYCFLKGGLIRFTNFILIPIIIPAWIIINKKMLFWNAVGLFLSFLLAAYFIYLHRRKSKLQAVT